MRSTVVFVDGQEAGRLLDVEETTTSYSFPKAWDPLSVASLWDPAAADRPVREQVVYRIGQCYVGHIPVRVGWSSSGSQPTEDDLIRHVPEAILTKSVEAWHARMDARMDALLHKGPIEIVDPGRGPMGFCNAQLVLNPDRPRGLYWGHCRTCHWKTAGTRNFTGLDELLRAHNAAGLEHLRQAARQWREANPDFDVEKNAAEILAGLAAMSALLDQWGA